MVSSDFPQALPAAMDRTRRLFLLAGTSLVLPALGGCVSRLAGAPSWQARLSGDTVALLGEVHDNPEHHRLRAAALRHACQAGWRPAIVMEQFDLDRQPDLDRGRRDRPGDAAFLIASASPSQSGWHWPYYEPLVALALRFDLPLFASNLPRAQATRIVREGYEAVLGRSRTQELGLAAEIEPRWRVAQESEIEAGHCGLLPAALLQPMARAQFARDAVMAQVLRNNSANGAVLLAGNGHVRRDIGVPQWLAAMPLERQLVVGFVEVGDPIVEGQFDAVVVTARAERKDPCNELRR